MASPLPLLDPKLDVVFKLLFADERNHQLLVQLVGDLLGPERPVLDLTVLNPEISRDSLYSKGVVLDVRVRLRDGSQVDIEMQAAPHAGLRQRALFYWARLYTSQLQMGENYELLRPSICLFILDFRELETPEFLSIFQLLDPAQRPFSDGLRIAILELPKIPLTPTTVEPPLAKWGRFLKSKSREALEELTMNYPELKAAREALEQLSGDPAARALAEERLVWAFNHAVESNLLLEKGRQEGRDEALRAVIGRQLQRRFGTLPPQAEQRLLVATSAELEQWGERVLEAASLDDVLA